MKAVYSLAKVTLKDDNEIDTMESEGKGYYADYVAASNHAANLHDNFGDKYVILQVIGITGTIIKPVDTP